MVCIRYPRSSTIHKRTCNPLLFVGSVKTGILAEKAQKEGR